MKPKEFIAHLDDATLLSAIAEAEKKSSGEIRLYVSHKKQEDPLEAAQRHFIKLGMSNTKNRNGVLIYFAPAFQKFAIWGDIGVHEKCGEDFWRHLVDHMAPLLKEGRYTEAIVHAIHEVGAVLARHFPRQPDDQDELPNQIARD